MQILPKTPSNSLRQQLRKIKDRKKNKYFLIIYAEFGIMEHICFICFSSVDLSTDN